MAETTEATNIQRVEVDSLDNLLGIPGAENIMTATGNEKPGFFGRQKVDTNFLNPTKQAIPTPVVETPVGETPEAKVTREAAEKKTKEDKEKADLLAKGKEKGAEDLTQILTDLDPNKDPEAAAKAAEEASKNAGRPKVDKEGMIELTKKFIEKGLMVPFEGDKSVDDYTMKDFEELIEANFNDREAKIKESTPVEFFDSLPPELQVAAKYVADGGKDMKGIFRALSQVEETRSLDPTKDKDQESIVREYLRATNFGTEDDIQDEIIGWKDMNKLAEKATKFKPKLDQMNEQMVAQKLAYQEKARKEQEAGAQHYMKSIYDTLKTAELGGLKLDKKVQSQLYNGLVSFNYPSITGNNTNLLGHLLEKYQRVEPNPAIIAEALWLLSDPDGYKAKIKEGGKTEAAVETARKLKTEATNKQTSGNGSGVIEDTTKTKTRTIPRNQSFFARS